MRLILKKKDGLTSLLLFVYNNYLFTNSKASIKLSNLLEIMKAFGKNETATRMSLSRAMKAGLLINCVQNNEVIYELTLEGKSYIELWNEEANRFWKRYQYRESSFDNNWYYVSILSGQNSNESKVDFIDALRQYGFAQLNANTYVSPYHQHQEVLELIEKYDLSDGIVELYGEMKVHKDIDIFLNEIFTVNNLNEQYQQFIDKYKDKLIEIRKVCKLKDFVDGGLALPLLNELGWDFFGIATLDAALPKQILQKWQGDEAVQIMKELRTILFDATCEYLKKFE